MWYFMRIEIDNILVNVEIVRKNNKNTYMRVKNGVLVVTTNYMVSDRKMKEIIINNKNSIIKMLEKDNRLNEKNNYFYLFGKKYDVVYGSFNEIDITCDKIYVKNEKELNKYLNKEIYKIFSDRLMYWYSEYVENIPRPNLKIRKMTSRWGVCNIKNNNITLNSELYKYDITCLDYVIVHELSHFIYPNHSKNFWLQVSKYYPKYKEARKMLKE